MRRRGTGRFALALVACLAAGDVAFPTAVEVGAGFGGGWGVLSVLGLSGVGLALLFTVVYDGPSSLRGLGAQSHPRRRNIRYSPTQQTTIRPSAKG